jgi:hypothetical protein
MIAELRLTTHLQKYHVVTRACSLAPPAGAREHFRECGASVVVAPGFRAYCNADIAPSLTSGMLSGVWTKVSEGPHFVDTKPCRA